MVESREKAFEILGLKDGASNIEIDNRYSILLKRYKPDLASGDYQDKIKIIENIDQAYKLLKGINVEIEKQEYRESRLLKKLGVDEKKARNFLYYYKIHIVASIIVIIFLAVTIRGCIMRVDPDFNMGIIGNFYKESLDGLKEIIEDNIEGINEISFDEAIIYPDMDGEIEIAMQSKLMIMIAAAEMDILILDKNYFNMYAEMGVFAKLDSYIGEMFIKEEQISDTTVMAEDDDREYIYGIDVSESPLFEKAGIYGNEFIATVKVNTKHFDSCLKVLKMFLE